MLLDILIAVGGLGIFLIGMQVMTDGLKAVAGSALRRILTRFTKDPLSGAVTGACTTAVVQSSSATTVAAVGFVGAGLLTFPQALGIVFGANIGTTSAGWMVAVIGFKLDLGQLVLPLALTGVLLKIFGHGRLKPAGWAIAGFSLLFIGIDTLQQGMAAFEGRVTPDIFPEDTAFGRLKLIGIGVVITLVTQSSSAGVAAALVALGAGAISFPQAAAMVIGMDVGTTVTAAVATLGGSAAVRRTGFAHVIFNLFTGVLAYLLLVPYAVAIEGLLDLSSMSDAQIAVVGFHSFFNGLGVVLIIGFAKPFGQFIIRLIPEKGPVLTRRLDDKLLSEPSAALDAGTATAQDITHSLITYVHGLASAGKTGTIPPPSALRPISVAIEHIHDFLNRINAVPGGADHQRLQSLIHVTDHLARLAHRAEQRRRLASLRADQGLATHAETLAALISESDPFAVNEGMLHKQKKTAKAFRKENEIYRSQLIGASVVSSMRPEEVSDRLDAMRWLYRVSYHLWRIHHNIGAAVAASSVVGQSDKRKKHGKDQKTAGRG